LVTAPDIKPQIPLREVPEPWPTDPKDSGIQELKANETTPVLALKFIEFDPWWQVRLQQLLGDSVVRQDQVSPLCSEEGFVAHGSTFTDCSAITSASLDRLKAMIAFVKRQPFRFSSEIFFESCG
jgi:hypothetical protein